MDAVMRKPAESAPTQTLRNVPQHVNIGCAGNTWPRLASVRLLFLPESMSDPLPAVQTLLRRRKHLEAVKNRLERVMQRGGASPLQRVCKHQVVELAASLAHSGTPVKQLASVCGIDRSSI